MDTVQFFAENINLPFPSTKASVLKRWLFLVAQREKRELAEINYVFCSDEHLLQINQEYLQHDYYTDIITFDNSEEDEQELESDIFISVDRVQDNASQLGISFELELLRVMVHGLLHLCGYGDKEEEDIRVMRAKEDQYVSLFFDTQNK